MPLIDQNIEERINICDRRGSIDESISCKLNIVINLLAHMDKELEKIKRH